VNEVLHAIRVKGIASEEAIAAASGLPAEEIQRQLAELERDGDAFLRPSRKRPGWVLSERGRDRHAAWLQEAHDEPTRQALGAHYEGFLAINASVKGVSARWQTAATDADRFALIDRIEDLHASAVPVLERAAGTVPRFGRYGERLDAALQLLERDPRYFVSPLVDSYHTVWFECHEDFLVTLGRSRHEEGSW
jgi:hypothetical protein